MDDARTRPDDSLPLFMWIGFFAMILGQFMAVLDIQIVASAIGAIQAGVSASRSEVSWVQTAYLIAEVIGIPLAAFLARAMGTRFLFCLSAGLFGVSSVLCAFAWDIQSLVIFRAMQGFCGAAMIPTTAATMFIVMPKRLQPWAGAMTGVITSLAPSLGPTVGGYIAEVLGWRALFWINVPPAIACVVLVWRFMRLPAGDWSLLKRIDVPGLIGLALFLGCAEFVLEEGASKDWFASVELILFALVSGLGGFLFFSRAFTVAEPIVDLRPFKTPSFAVGSILVFIVGLTLFAAIFLMPIYLGNVRGYNALQIGHAMFMQGAVMFVVGPLVGIFGRRIPDMRPLGVLGFLLVSASCLIQTQMTADWGLEELMLPQALRGAGLIFAFTSVMQPAITSLPPHLVHAGTGIFNTIRNIGGAFGIAVIATMQTYSFAFHRQELYSAIDPNNPHVTQMLEGMQGFLEQSGAASPERQALMYYAQILDREAMVMTFNDLFLFLAFVLAIGAAMVYLVRPKRGAELSPEALAAAH